MNKIHFIEQNLYWNVAKILNNYDFICLSVAHGLMQKLSIYFR